MRSTTISSNNLIFLNHPINKMTYQFLSKNKTNPTHSKIHLKIKNQIEKKRWGAMGDSSTPNGPSTTRHYHRWTNCPIWEEDWPSLAMDLAILLDWMIWEVLLRWSNLSSQWRWSNRMALWSIHQWARVDVQQTHLFFLIFFF